MRIKCLNTYEPKVPDQSLGHGEYSVCLLALPTCGQVNWCLRCGTEMSQEHQMPSSPTEQTLEAEPSSHRFLSISIPANLSRDIINDIEA